MTSAGGPQAARMGSLFYMAVCAASRGGAATLGQAVSVVTDASAGSGGAANCYYSQLKDNLGS